MKKLLALSLLVPTLAYAADATITWQHPTRNVDGTTIPTTGAGSIASTRLQVGTCSGTAFGTVISENIVQGQGTTTTFTNLAPGSTVCFRGYSRNTYGEESSVSNIVARIIPAPVPQPPVLSTTVNVVWDYRGFFKGLEIAGIAPLGTACDEKSFVIRDGVTYNEVDASAVTLINPRQPKKLVSICQKVG
jgi:hypothetical protein